MYVLSAPANLKCSDREIAKTHKPIPFFEERPKGSPKPKTLICTLWISEKQQII